MEKVTWNLEKVRGRWIRAFEHLKKITPLCAYLTILGLARNIKHLEKLHGMLPANARLLRLDFLNLGQFWERYFSGEFGEKHKSQLLEWILSEQSQNDGGAQSYYWEKIADHSSHRPLSPLFLAYQDGSGNFSRLARILSESGRSGHGDNHFRVKIFGEVLKTAFHVHEDSGHMLMWFVLKESKLDEPFTHKLISQLPEYYVLGYGVNRGVITAERTDHFLHIAFQLDAEELVKYTLPCGERDWVATDKFPQAAADFLRKKGIPVEEIFPIVDLEAEAGEEE